MKGKSRVKSYYIFNMLPKKIVIFKEPLTINVTLISKKKDKELNTEASNNLQGVE